MMYAKLMILSIIKYQALSFIIVIIPQQHLPLFQKLMTTINPSLLKSLNSSLTPEALKYISSRLEKQSQPASNQKSRLSTSASLASKHHYSIEAERGSSNHTFKQFETSKPARQSESVLGIQYRNSKAVYYRTNDLPSLHSIDSIMSECIRHTRTQRNINQHIQSADLLKIKQLQVFYCQIESLRLFGTGWKIKSLTVIGCKLKDLSGINGFLSLECLFASYNEIEVLSDLAFSQTLRVIDLEGNQISNIDELEYLLTVDNLEMVNLDYNPVMTEKRKQVENLFSNLLQTEQYDVEGHKFDNSSQEDDQDLFKFENVLLIDHINKQLSSKDPYYEVISQLKRDKYTDYTQKQFTLDGRFNNQATQEEEAYLMDDITIFHNPKKALEKDSVQKYLSLKFSLPQQGDPGSAVAKSKVFIRRASSKKSLENKEQRQYSTISSKISIKNQDLVSTGLEFNASGSNAFTDTILSQTGSQPKRKFVLRKTSLKKDTNLISQLHTPTSLNKQMFYRTSSFLNK